MISFTNEEIIIFISLNFFLCIRYTYLIKSLDNYSILHGISYKLI